MTEQRLRVLIVDDTIHYRRLLSEMMESIAEVELVGAIPRGGLAVARLQATPVDLVLLDLEMPEMDGLETLREIRRLRLEPEVVMVCSQSDRSARARVEALTMGVLEFVTKPEAGSAEASRAELTGKLRTLIDKVRAARKSGADSGVASERSVAPVQRVAPVVAAAAPVNRTALLSVKPKRFDLVVVGISTGGPEALLQFIPKLPHDLGVPVMVVQHMPPVFTASLAQDLARRSRMQVKEACEGEELRAGVVFIAPGGKHMVVRAERDAATNARSHRVGLTMDPPENSCRPAADVLFRSAAACFGGSVLALVMTGMGSDGCEGMRELQRVGCYGITQSAASCVVYGMPLAVDEAGLSHESVPLDRLAARVVSLVSRENR